MMEINLYKVFAIILAASVVQTQTSQWDFQTINYGDKSELLHNIFKEELQELRKDLTTSFVEEHSRNKRATQNYGYEAKLVELEVGGQNSTFVTTADATTVIFKDEMYILDKTGLYKINGLDGYSINSTLVSTWDLSKDHRVVATIEKGNVLFIFVENSKEGFSFIYTFTFFSQFLVLRQRIRNPGFVTAVKFFVFYDQLYLIILNDNKVHSLTTCPIFIWAGTYFDELHSIQTRGANAVEVFVIEGYQYLAICQNVDAAGNTEVGTQVVRMDRRGELEKVQLLYSNNPVALHFTKNFHEHILIIVQKKEPAIVYFFGGYDFIYLQHLPSLKGDEISILSVLDPHGETYIVASNGRFIRVFVRALDYSALTALMFAPYPSNTLEVPEEYAIIGLLVKPPSSGQQSDQINRLIIAITYRRINSKDETIIHFQSLVFEKKPKSDSQKQPEEKLSKCLTTLKTLLDNNEPILKQLKKSNDTILRKSSNMNYGGMLNSQTRLSLTRELSVVESLRIKPDLNLEDEITMSPSQLETKIMTDMEIFNTKLTPKLASVLINDETNVLNGHLDFVNGVAVKELIASYSTIKLSTLNGVPWTSFRYNTLRNDNQEVQMVTGNWSIDNFSAAEVLTVNTMSGINLQDILLTQTKPEVVQTVSGHMLFEKIIEFKQSLDVPSTEKINDIDVWDIANRNTNPTEITGMKTGLHVKGGSGLIVQLVNQVNLDNWYNSILKTTGNDQVANGTYFFDGDFTAENIETELVNRVNWNEFIDQILIDGKDQIIKDKVHFGNFLIESLKSAQINGVVVDDLLTTSRNQDITAKISTDHVIVTGDVTNEQVNGIRIPEDVVLNSQDSVIHGPIEFQSVTADNIELADGALISGVDLVQKTQEGKTVIYTVDGNEPIVFTGKFFAQNVKTSTINGINIENFSDTHWKIQGNNIITTPNIDVSKVQVIVENSFTTESLNDRPVADYVKINGHEDEYVNVPIAFTKPAVVYQNLQMAENVTLNDVDLSNLVQNIISPSSTGFVHGVKSFTQPINSNQGIRVASINNKNIENDVVMLRNGKNFYEIPGQTIFLNNVESNVAVIYGNSSVGGTVNTIDMSQIIDTTVYTNKYSAIRGDVEFLHDIYITDFNVGGVLNSFPITNILDTLVSLDSGATPQYIALDLVVEGSVSFQGPANIELINGVSPTAYFSALVNKSTNELIQNQKIFQGLVFIKENLNCDDGVINNVNLLKLEEEALSKTKNQIVTGNFTFKEIEAGDIFTRTLCGIPVDDFVLTNDIRPIPIESPVYFTSTEPTVVQGDILVNKLFNGQNITRVEENLTNPKGNKSFSTVKCHGDLRWTRSRENSKGLSYVFENAVVTTGKENQTITGNVKFLKGFKATVIKTAQWLNGVDIEFIIKDGVIGRRDLNFTGNNRIPNIEITEGGWLETLPLFSTKYVNGVNLTRLNEITVRKNSIKVIEGVKILKNNVFIDSLNADSVNGCSLNDVARVNDDRLIRSLTIENIQGLKDLQFNNLDEMDWNKFLQERVTFDTPQQINGNITFTGNVNVQNCNAAKINDLDLNDLVVKNTNHVQKIKGQKTIGHLIIAGNIQADSINNYDINKIQPNILYKNKPQTIHQTVHFEGPVYLQKDLEVASHINEKHSLKEISLSFDNQLNEIIKKANTTKESQVKSQNLLKVLQDELQDSATWLDYLSLARKLKSVGKKDRVEATVSDSRIRISFSKMIPVYSHDGGLPNGCLCNSIDFVEIGLNYFRMNAELHCKNVFNLVSSHSDSSFTVYSTYTSYNETCKSTVAGITDIFSTSTVGNLPILVSQLQTGFISDAKIFNVYGVDYIVIGQFYDHTKDGPYKGQVTVYSVVNSTHLTLVQTIPTKGTIKLALENINSVWFLGVANSLKNTPVTKYQDSHDECETVSEIYVWQSFNQSDDSPNGKFILLREVMTKNVIDVEIIKVPKRNASFVQAAFITFVHNENVIEIFKFDWISQNFLLHQTISFDDEFQVTALTSFSIKDSTYLIVSSIPQGLLVYEYRCVEGFKLYLEVPLAGVEDVKSIIVNNQLLLPIASSYETIIAKGNIQGLISDNY